MKNRINTTWVSLGFASLLTLGKFFFYYLSGSVAVLSEAWHSFSDIATSLVVLIFLYRNQVLQKARQDQDPAVVKNSKTSFIHRILDINHELKISFFIGGVLLCISGSILWNVMTKEAAELSRPLVTGIFFLLFSGGSYLLYRVQTGVGQNERSAALHADGIHSRADAVISFLTGLVLMIYFYFDINLDRYMGGMTALVLFVFSIELLTNSAISLARNKNTYVREVTPLSLITLFFSRRLYDKASDFFLHILYPAGTHDMKPGLLKWGKIIRNTVFSAVVAATVLIYASTCFYRIDTGHQGLKLRFGKIVNPSGPDTAGLHMKYPWPFETFVSIPAEKISTLTVDNLIIEGRMLVWAEEHENTKAFISGDNNLFLPYTAIHFKIKDPVDYYINSREPEKLIKSMALSLMTRAFSHISFYDLALHRRQEWINQVGAQLQQALDAVNSGIEILGLYVQDLHPPAMVSASFEEVVAALQKKEELLNEALAFKNEYLPRTRGETYKELKKAEIYVDDTTNRAAGETQQYLLQQEGFTADPEILKSVLFYQSVLKAINPVGSRVIIDPGTGISSKEIYNEKFLFRMDRRN